MSTSYDDWKCDSGREDDGQFATPEVLVTCAGCSRELWVRADEPPPYWHHDCEHPTRDEAHR